MAHMDNQERTSKNKSPFFDGSNYAFWSIKMRVYLQSLGYDVWKSVKNGYTAPESQLYDVVLRSSVKITPKP
jgi:hypothetical protein